MIASFNLKGLNQKEHFYRIDFQVLKLTLRG